MKVYRYIAIVLLVCFSAFLGHNLVPHHHHSDTLLSPLATDCPIEHGDHHCCDQESEGEDHHPDHHHDQHPSHCHAFNDVVFQKHNAQVIKPVLACALIWASPYSELVPDRPAASDFTFFNGLKIPIKTIELCGSRGLRGPPRAA